MARITKKEVARNYTIDALRIVAVCFVVYIHIFAINPGVNFTSGTSWKIIDILFGLSRLAVPVFFAISGWFIFSSDRDHQLSKLKKQVPRLLKLFLAGTIGTSIALWILDTLHLLNTSFDYFPNIKDIYHMFLLGSSPTIAPLWFLASLIIVEVMYLIVTRFFKKDTWLAAVAAVFFVVSLAFSTYRPQTHFPALPDSINETWIVAFVWFTLGYFLAKYFSARMTTIKMRTFVVFAVIAGALYFYEYILQTSGAPLTFGPFNYSTLFIFTPLATAAILLLAARIDSALPLLRLLAYVGKNYALGVFIIHLVVMQPIYTLVLRTNLLGDEPTVRLAVTYTSTILISIALTALYYNVKARYQAFAHTTD